MIHNIRSRARGTQKCLHESQLHVYVKDCTLYLETDDIRGQTDVGPDVKGELRLPWLHFSPKSESGTFYLQVTQKTVVLRLKGDDGVEYPTYTGVGKFTLTSGGYSGSWEKAQG